MIEPGFEQGGTYEIPQEITAFADSLTPGSITGTTDSHIIETRLAYGSQDTEEALAYATGELADKTRAFTEQLGDFLRTGQENVPIPVYAVTDTYGRDHPDHMRASVDVNSWLRVVHEHTPEQADASVAMIMETAHEIYDHEAFSAVIADNQDDYTKRNIALNLERSARHTVNILSSIVTRATDTQAVRDFMESPLYKDYATQEAQAKLLCHLVRTEGHLDPEDMTGTLISNDYARLITLADGMLAEGSFMVHVGSEAIRTIAEKTPLAINQLGLRNPHAAERLDMFAAEQILKLDADAFTPAHQTALNYIETACSTDVRRYGSYINLIHQSARGTITPTQLEHLTNLLANNPDTNPEARLGGFAALVCAYTDDEKLPQLIAEKSFLTVSDDAKSVAIRRLARLGHIEQAMGLIDKPSNTLDSWASVYAPIHNALGVYEETGNPAVLADADARLAALMSGKKKWLHPHEYISHAFAARRYVGARKADDHHEAWKAMGIMEQCHTSADTYSREKSLKTSLQLFVDMGDLEQAAFFANRIYADDSLNAHDYRTPGRDALLYLANAYVQADQTDKAVELVKPLLEKRSYDALYAVDIIAKKPRAFVTPIYAGHLDPLKSEYLGR